MWIVVCEEDLGARMSLIGANLTEIIRNAHMVSENDGSDISLLHGSQE